MSFIYGSCRSCVQFATNTGNLVPRVLSATRGLHCVDEESIECSSSKTTFFLYCTWADHGRTQLDTAILYRAWLRIKRPPQKYPRFRSRHTMNQWKVKVSLQTADVSPRSSPTRDVSRGGTSAIQRQKFRKWRKICLESGQKRWLDVGVVTLV